MKSLTIVFSAIFLAVGFALLFVKPTKSTSTTPCGQFPIDEPQYEWPTQTRIALFVPSADMGTNTLTST